MKVFKCITLALFALCSIGLISVAEAKDTVGSIVALRGGAVIERDGKALAAKVKDGFFMADAVSTLETSRAKLLFIDDSVLSMAEKSRVVVREFLYAKDKGGKSIFNLIDGKMKAVVGKTEFEVHTPTAVAAARGTIVLFHVGTKNGRKFTTLICVHTTKEVLVSSPDANIKGQRKLTSGSKITLFEREPLPNVSQASAADVNEIQQDTDMADEIPLAGPGISGPKGTPVTNTPPVDQQPIPQKIETSTVPVTPPTVPVTPPTVPVTPPTVPVTPPTVPVTPPTVPVTPPTGGGDTGNSPPGFSSPPNQGPYIDGGGVRQSSPKTK